MKPETLDSTSTRYPDQQRLLEQVAARIPANVSLVNELSLILDISTDSAYRRIRGETELSFSETVTLCNHFHITFDSLASSGVNVVSFVYNDYNESLESFENYLLGLSDEMDQISAASAEKSHITFIGPGMPVLHFLDAPNLGPFKIFYWIKSMNIPESNYRKFNVDLISDKLIDAGKNIHKNYMQIPSTEIWTDSSVQGILNQIRFCWDTGIFESKENALAICEELRLLLRSIEDQAAVGKKGSDGSIEFRLFYSELEDENTCIHVEVGDMNTVYHGHWNHRFLKTSNQEYCETTRKWYENLEKKSLLISGTSESARYQFFKRGLDKLELLEKHISNT